MYALMAKKTISFIHSILPKLNFKSVRLIFVKTNICQVGINLIFRICIHLVKEGILSKHHSLFYLVCDNSTYGSNCVHNCSRNCLNDSPCNKETGHCEAGCNQGYSNKLCNQGNLMFIKILSYLKSNLIVHYMHVYIFIKYLFHSNQSVLE